MDNFWVGAFVAALVVVVLVLTWDFGGNWQQIQFKKLCERDGFVYMFEKRYDCHTSALKSPQ